MEITQSIEFLIIGVALVLGIGFAPKRCLRLANERLNRKNSAPRSQKSELIWNLV